MAIGEERLNKLIEDIRNNRITLPSLPEVAVKVRKYVDDPEMGTSQLSRIISTDPVLSARLLQVANSPFFRCLNPSASLQSAVNRLGAICVRNVVTSLVMAQLYKTNVSGSIKSLMKDLWEHTTKVAAYSHVISSKYSRLDPEQCMVAGLLHSIGYLPVLTELGNNKALLEEKDDILASLEEIHPQIGRIILETWDFPEEVTLAVSDHRDLDRTHEGSADVTDIVLVANLHALLGSGNPLCSRRWDEIPAFALLGLTPEESISAMKEASAEISGIQKLLRA